EGVKYTLVNMSFIDVAPNTSIPVPLDLEHVNPKPVLNYLPFLVKSNEEREIAIELLLSYEHTRNADAYAIISKTLEGVGLGVEIRINEKYRSYTLHIARPR